MPQAPSRWATRRRTASAVAARAGVAIAQAVAPRAAGRLAERLWFTPPRPPSAVLDRHGAPPPGARPIIVHAQGHDLRGYTVGDGPAVVLVHGWGGWAGQFTPLASALARAGMSATAIDLPGHGSDPRGRSDVLQFIAALDALTEQQGPPAAVVGHSLGAMSSVLAYDATPPAAAAFIAPGLSVERILVQFARMLALRPATAAELRARVRRFAGDLWERMEVGPDMTWPEGPLLIVHDREDPQVPFAHSAELAAARAGTELLATRGLGHNRVLRDAAVVEAVTAFVTAHVPVSVEQ